MLMMLIGVSGSGLRYVGCVVTCVGCATRSDTRCRCVFGRTGIGLPGSEILDFRIGGGSSGVLGPRYRIDRIAS